MNFKVRVNNDKNKTFDLCEWYAPDFNVTRLLKIKSNDLNTIKSSFENIDEIHILKDDEIIGTYTVYNTYANISYTSSMYVERLGNFCDCITVELSRRNFIEELTALQNQINPVADVGSMNVNEYRNYVLGKIAEDCAAHIYEGDVINGHRFTYKVEDQQNLKTLFDTVVMSPQVAGLPYHASGENCRFYTREEIITIYTTLMMRLINITTYCNALNMMIKEMTSKDELEQVAYGMALSEEKQALYDEIMSQTATVFSAVLDNYTSVNSDADTDNTEVDVDNNEANTDVDSEE